MATGYDGDRWFTPVPLIEDIRSVLGSIDLDPASEEKANERVKAKEFYTEEKNGLNLANKWYGNIFLNPPYSAALIKGFTQRAIHDWNRSSKIESMIILTNNATDTSWCQNLLRSCTIFCLIAKRTSFDHPDRASTMPRQGQILYLFARDEMVITRFWGKFRDRGLCKRL